MTVVVIVYELGHSLIRRWWRCGWNFGVRINNCHGYTTIREISENKYGEIGTENEKR